MKGCPASIFRSIPEFCKVRRRFPQFFVLVLSVTVLVLLLESLKRIVSMRTRSIQRTESGAEGSVEYKYEESPKQECQRMMDKRNGRRIRVPASRRLSWDLLYFHRDVPLCAHDRRMSLADVSEGRNACAERVSWPALFLRAYAIVAQEVPELRQTWYRWPWSHLYQHPCSVATLTVQREMHGEPWLFWGQIASPELNSLSELQRAINQFRDGDVRQVFRKQLQLAKLPTVFRRMIWWWNLNVATASRAKRLGTFFLSTLAGRGAEIQLPPSIHTGCLTFGPLDENGIARVTLAYDHRIMDGALVADILQRLEETLNGALLHELRAMQETKCSEAA